MTQDQVYLNLHAKYNISSEINSKNSKPLGENSATNEFSMARRHSDPIASSDN